MSVEASKATHGLFSPRCVGDGNLSAMFHHQGLKPRESVQ
ncbi:hypothetical protein BV133_408 [Blastochloris viridis]|uniref:Uncharacterized protein n=1 Tax=Blastochloris viridis TaxID=1079 RepID=A0A182CZF5_BLAVI|nr:hypothetical protein BV133_408 [Blastochloris viridis]